MIDLTGENCQLHVKYGLVMAWVTRKNVIFFYKVKHRNTHIPVCINYKKEISFPHYSVWRGID